MIAADTRFWIPVAAIQPEHQAQVGQLLGLDASSLASILVGPITDHPPDTGCHLVRFDRVVCLTIGLPACPLAGFGLENELALARMPYLRRHLGNAGCSPGATACVPDQPPADISCNAVDEPVIAVEVIDGQPLVDRQGLEEIARYAAIRRQVLSSGLYLT